MIFYDKFYAIISLEGSEKDTILAINSLIRHQCKIFVCVLRSTIMGDGS